MTSSVASAAYAAHVAAGYVTCCVCRVRTAAGVVTSGARLDRPGPAESALCGPCMDRVGRTPGDVIDRRTPAQT